MAVVGRFVAERPFLFILLLYPPSRSRKSTVDNILFIGGISWAGVVEQKDVIKRKDFQKLRTHHEKYDLQS